MPKPQPDEFQLRHLKALRKAGEMTQFKLARCMGCTQGFISQVENGGNTMSLANAMRAAECLGIEVDDLLHGPNDGAAAARAAIKSAGDDRPLAEAFEMLSALPKDAFSAVYAMIKELRKLTNGSLG